MSKNIYTVLCCLTCAAVGFAAGWLCVRIFNAMPAKWLCDYDEVPKKELLGERAAPKKYGLVLGTVLSASFILLYFQYSAASFSFYLACLACLPIVLAAFSDIKYQIIPDQCVLALAAVAAANYICDLCIGGKTFYGSVASPFLGALCGGGLWILLGLLGRLLYRKESVGFGDVKLFAAVGFLCGFEAVFLVFLITILAAGIHFAVLLFMKKFSGDKYMPMGPYICAACIAAVAFKSQLSAFVAWYFSIMH